MSVGALILPPGEVWDERLGELGQMAKKAGVTVYSMKPETSIREKDMEITCLGPSESVLPGNEASLILALNYQSFDMLLTGDVEGEGEKALTDRIRKEPEKNMGSTESVSSRIQKFYRRGVFRSSKSGIYNHLGRAG